jgi:hypothetical protein
VDALLNYTLHAERSYHHSGPIFIGFGIENLTPRDIWVLKWYTPLEGIRGKIFEVECDGVPVPYAHLMVKRGNPSATDYLRLAPGKSVRVDFDLSLAYTLPIAKECNVRFKGRIHDVVLDPAHVPRAAESHSPVMIEGSELVFAVV